MGLFDEQTPEEYLAKCNRLKARTVNNNVRANTLHEAMKKLGCDAGPLETLVQCISRADVGPESMIQGGFVPHVPETQGDEPYVPKIVIVAEHVHGKSVFDRTLTHELVHAFDQCRANVQWGNLHHLACAEIRASNLSGECELIQEINRGNAGVVKHHQTCVRRRAALSIAMGMGKTEAAKAAEAVNAVFDKCYADKAPFED
ncbi:peptidase M76 [Pelagophyceae sp. CCMP2097]|nr:peptidase M76 [Pelagophyceae sp. CCMP2097]